MPKGSPPAWDPIEAYWRDPSIANREALRAVLSPEGVRDAHLTGVPDPRLLSPDAWLHDQVFPDRTLGRAAAHTRAWSPRPTAGALLMRRLPYVRCSPRGEASKSTRIARAFLPAYREAHPEAGFRRAHEESGLGPCVLRAGRGAASATSIAPCVARSTRTA